MGLMNRDKLKIYFLGSGRIAVPLLSRLAVSQNISLVGIGTQKDRPAGRKRHIRPTPVGEWCEAQGLVADKPDSVNSPGFAGLLRGISPDMIFVSSFGQILKQEILSLPRLGCINLHASVLPAYRGASPLQAAILGGDRITGVSFMRMEKGLDTGPVYHVCEYEILPGQRADELEHSLGELASRHLEGVLLKIASGELSPRPQDDSRATHAGKIRKEHGEVCWADPARKIERMLRAYHPWPGIFFMIPHVGRKTRISVTDLVCLDICGNPGQILRADNRDLVIACGEGALSLKKVVPEGKREMSGIEFVQGYHGLEGMTLGNG
ncbi:MAG: methionyl-tRNA formyltransferase [Victivallales bacterium]